MTYLSAVHAPGRVPIPNRPLPKARRARPHRDPQHREHNLKSIDVDIPKKQLVVVTSICPLGKILARLRHARTRRPAALRRVAVGLCSASSSARWRSRVTHHSGSVADDLDRAEGPGNKAPRSARSPRSRTICACRGRASAAEQLPPCKCAAQVRRCGTVDRLAVPCTRSPPARLVPDRARASTPSCSTRRSARLRRALRIDGQVVGQDEPRPRESQEQTHRRRHRSWRPPSLAFRAPGSMNLVETVVVVAVAGSGARSSAVRSGSSQALLAPGLLIRVSGADGQLLLRSAARACRCTGRLGTKPRMT